MISFARTSTVLDSSGVRLPTVHGCSRVVRTVCAAMILGWSTGGFASMAWGQTLVQEVLCVFEDAVRPSGLPKAGRHTGLETVDAVLSKFPVEQIERLPAFRITRLPGLPALARIRLTDPVALDSLREELARTGLVKTVTPNHVYRVAFVPNDSAFFAQWVPNKLRLPAVWDRVRASPDVVVGIIDTGIDPRHPDLVDAIWVNPGEDVDGDGRFSEADYNGLDDDGNGLVDDVWGWDFVDAPRFPDAGDYRTPDNEPYDEHGHGTAVAGIIGATGDNRIGIAGVAFGAKLMILRAGTSRGLLEEDDVASAILYALEMGARVINMSFGDTELAPFLQAVIRYAYEQGAVLVASAGNTGDDTPHYPAGLGETLSVGASTEADEVASFSSFGETIDFVAPGVSVLTTAPGGRYERFNGTSAAAPVVSGICALLLSREQALQPEQIRGKLASSAVDIWIAGWDRRSGAGRVDPLAALALSDEIYAQIREPCPGCAVGAEHEAIVGTASGPGFTGYALLLGSGESPTEWDTLATSSLRVVEDVLAEWQPALLPEGRYVLRLVVNGLDGLSLEDRVEVRVDRSAPTIEVPTFLPVYEGEWPAALLSFGTSDVTRAWLRWRPPGSTEWRTHYLRYLTDRHYALLSQEDLGEEFEYEIQVENLRGQSGVYRKEEGGFVYRFEGGRLATDWLVPALPDLPAGYLCPVATDVNGDGVPEIALSRFTGSGWGSLEVYEYRGEEWQLVARSVRQWLPRDAADVTGDGRDELLVGWGAESAVLWLPAGATELEEWWRKDDDFWAARFVDFDSDGRPEIAARWRGQWSLWEKGADGGFAFWLTLTNPSSGSNAYAVPRIGYGDTDGDGRREICFSDEDGDVLLYEFFPPDGAALLHQRRVPLPGSSPHVQLADLDGDDVDELVIGSHSSESISFEHEFDRRHWLVQIYRHGKVSEYNLWSEKRFFGYYDDQGFESSFGAADLDQDGRSEMLVCAAPDLYVEAYDPATNREEIVGYLPGVSTNAMAAADFDLDGRTEVAVGTGNTTRLLRASELEPTPPGPLRVWATVLDERSVLVKWSPVRRASRYEVQRSRGDSFEPLVEVDSQFAVDRSAQPEVTYRYRVRAVVDSEPGAWRLSNPVRTHRPPALASAGQAGETLLRVAFTSPMGETVLDPGRYTLRSSRGEVRVASVARGHRFSEVLVSASRRFDVPDRLQLVVRDVTDTSGTPIRPNPDTIMVDVGPIPQAPYLVEARRLSEQEVLLRFNQRMIQAELSDTSRYRVEPHGRVLEAMPEEDGRAVRLRLSAEAALKPLGKTYRIIVQDLHNLAGVPIRVGIGDRADIRVQAENLSEVIVYPNPWRPGLGTSVITLGGVPMGAEVYILDSSGRVLRKLDAEANTGGVSWDLKNDAGMAVASGIYLYLIKWQKDRKIGKFAVLR